MRGGPTLPPGSAALSPKGHAAALTKSGRDSEPLAFGERADLLVLGHSKGEQEATDANPAPAPLAHEQLIERHRPRLPRTSKDHLGGAQPPRPYSALQLGTCKSDAVRMLECAQALRRGARRRGGLPHRPLHKLCVGYVISRRRAAQMNGFSTPYADARLDRLSEGRRGRRGGA